MAEMYTSYGTQAVYIMVFFLNDVVPMFSQKALLNKEGSGKFYCSATDETDYRHLQNMWKQSQCHYI